MPAMPAMNRPPLDDLPRVWHQQQRAGAQQCTDGEEKINALFNLQASQWKEQQQEMAKYEHLTRCVKPR